MQTPHQSNYLSINVENTYFVISGKKLQRIEEIMFIVQPLMTGEHRL